jgi:hypothetical protein
MSIAVPEKPVSELLPLSTAAIILDPFKVLEEKH